MKTMNYSLIRILFALVIGLVLVLWPNTAASYIVITVGVAFLIPGVISLFGYFGRKKSEDGVSFSDRRSRQSAFRTLADCNARIFCRCPDVLVRFYPDNGRGAADSFLVNGSSLDTCSGSILSGSRFDFNCGHRCFIQSDRST